LVASTPPICALPSLPIDSGSRQPAAAAACCAAHPRQPRQAEHDLPAVLRRRGTADHAGVAALRHDGHALLRAQPHHRGDLGGVGRAHHRRRAAVIQPAPVDAVGGDIGRLRQQPRAADHCLQAIEKSAVDRRNGLRSAH
jgi:hypothetical protein